MQAEMQNYKIHGYFRIALAATAGRRYVTFPDLGPLSSANLILLLLPTNPCFVSTRKNYKLNIQIQNVI